MTSVTQHKLDQDADKIAMTELLQNLNGAKASLRRDECGDWTIKGNRGHIQTDGRHFYIYVKCRTKRFWNNKRRKLNLEVCQDGDNEGILILIRCNHLGKYRAAVIRDAIGLRQTRPPPPHAFQPDKNGL
jgi:hypothetical protein